MSGDAYPTQKEWIVKKFEELGSTAKIYELYDDFKIETNTSPSYETFKRRVRKFTTKGEKTPTIKDGKIKVDVERELLKDEVVRLKKALRNITKDLTLEEKLIRSLEAVVRSYKPYEKDIAFSQEANRSRDAVIMLSDWHLDEKVDKEEVFHINEFNWKIAEARIDYLFKKTIQNAIELKCSALNILLLGDFFSGIIKDDLIYGAEIGITPTIVKAFDIIARHMREAAKYFTIRVACVFGNHSRLTPMKGFNKAYTLNLEWMLYEFLRREAGEFAEDFVNPKSPIYIVNIQGYNFMITHGDMVSGGNNMAKIPATTFSRDAAKINGTLATKYAADVRHGLIPEFPQRVDYILAAHFHNEFTIPGFDDIPILGNGCLIGGNSFSLKVVKAASRPSQRFFIVEEGEGLRFMDTIFLDCISA